MSSRSSGAVEEVLGPCREHHRRRLLVGRLGGSGDPFGGETDVVDRLADGVVVLDRASGRTGVGQEPAPSSRHRARSSAKHRSLSTFSGSSVCGGHRRHVVDELVPRHVLVVLAQRPREPGARGRQRLEPARREEPGRTDVPGVRHDEDLARAGAAHGTGHIGRTVIGHPIVAGGWGASSPAGGQARQRNPAANRDDYVRPTWSPRKILIDTDPGIDDAMAIFYALAAPELDVVGLTTMFGNVDTTCARGTRCSSSRSPSARTSRSRRAQRGRWRCPTEVRPTSSTGRTRRATSTWRRPTTRPLAVTAAQFIVEQVRAAPGEITLVPLGPLTNIALALLLEPRLRRALAGIVLMGGNAFCGGNASPSAEANVINDPEAADSCSAPTARSSCAASTSPRRRS